MGSNKGMEDTLRKVVMEGIRNKVAMVVGMVEGILHSSMVADDPVEVVWAWLEVLRWGWVLVCLVEPCLRIQWMITMIIRKVTRMGRMTVGTLGVVMTVEASRQAVG